MFKKIKSYFINDYNNDNNNNKIKKLEKLLISRDHCFDVISIINQNNSNIAYCKNVDVGDCYGLREFDICHIDDELKQIIIQDYKEQINRIDDRIKSL